MDEYIDFFNKKAIENGFGGIYFIGLKSYDIDREISVYSKFNAKMFFQPRYLFNKKFFQRKKISSALEKKLRRLPEKAQLLIGRIKFLFEKKKKLDYIAVGEELL